ncbi:hypothetical protein CF5_0079 [Staphylococcus phage CF5]|uniref:Uncharacterized protein n=1 Tax=Staphylococcus phage CF5 TaxID=3113739 RepID=A0AAX4J6Y2_9CAUD|nr:hypothetical protein CF5_0079 [Staphylococcus phage CF5]
MEENTLTLEESITPLSKEEKENDMKEFSSLVCEMVNRLYKSYNLFRQDPVDDTQKLDGSLMVFQSRLNDPLTGDLHEKIFKLVFDKRINVFEANKQFREDVREGKAIELGDVAIIDTAMSNVLSGNEFNISITFMLRKDYEEKQRIEQEEKEKLDNL